MLEYDGEIRARVLRSVLRRLGSVPDQSATHASLRFMSDAVSGSSYDVAGGIRIERAYDVFRVVRVQPDSADQSVRVDSCDEGAADANIGGRRWRVRWMTSPVTDGGARFDCTALRFPLLVRGWRPGDRMRLAYGSKKLKKLFAEQRVPFHARAAVPVLVDAEDRVLWVAGVARSIEAPVVAANPALTITVSDAEIS